MFADDTKIFIQGKDMAQIQNGMNDKMIKISACVSVNKLSLNFDKTHCMLLKGNRKFCKELK